MFKITSSLLNTQLNTFFKICGYCRQGILVNKCESFTNCYLQIANKEPYWSCNKPMVVFERPVDSPKVTVWCDMSCNRLYGPLFFEDAQTGNACTVTTKTYLWMLETVMDVDITPDICMVPARRRYCTHFGNC